MTTTLHLVRHGETSGEDAADPGLSALGRRQAYAVARRLAPRHVDVLVHSPKRRARETAEIIADRLGAVAAEPDDHADDRTPCDRPLHRAPERYAPFLEQVPVEERDPDGQRLDAAFDHFGALATGDRTLIDVTHAFVIGWFVRRALDAPTWRWLGLNHLNGAVTTIALTPNGSHLIAFNDSGHLPE
jgi:broad specificity phosphatase PhoE